jgi:hypothetical protein
MLTEKVSSETWLHFQQATRRQDPDRNSLNSHLCEKLKSDTHRPTWLIFVLLVSLLLFAPYVMCNYILLWFVVKGPAAEATDAPQPWGLLCNPIMNMISFFSVFFSCNGAPVEWNWQEKIEVLGEKTLPSATLSTTNPTWTDPRIELRPPRWEAGG